MAATRFQGTFDFVRRFPVGVLSLSLCLPLGVAVYLLRSAIARADVEYENINETGVTMSEAVAGVRNIRSQAAMTRAAVQQIDAGLIDENNLAENLWYFYQIEEQTHAHISELHQLTSGTIHPEAVYKVVPFSLRIAGSYEQVANYLYRLETGPRMLRISSYEIQRQDSAGGIVMLSLSLEILARP
jgi:Tfp pilus assembly protein PilO